MGVKYAFPPWRGFRIVLANRKEKMFGKIWRDFFFLEAKHLQSELQKGGE